MQRVQVDTQAGNRREISWLERTDHRLAAPNAELQPPAGSRCQPPPIQPEKERQLALSFLNVGTFLSLVKES